MVGSWTVCRHLRVHVHCRDSRYLSFISLQSCRCDTGAAAERAGEGPGAPGHQQPSCKGGGRICSSIDEEMFRPCFGGLAESTAPGQPKVGLCYGWVGKGESAVWA